MKPAKSATRGTDRSASRGDTTLDLGRAAIRDLPVRAQDARKAVSVTEYRDTGVPGLILRVWPSGARSLYACYSVRRQNKHGQMTSITRRYLVGAVGEKVTPPATKKDPDPKPVDLTVQVARDIARTIKARAREGHDPHVDKQRGVGSGLTLKTLGEKFLAERPRKRGGEWRAKSAEGYEGCLRKHIYPAFQHRDPEGITQQEVAALVRRVARERKKAGGRGTQANRVLSTLRRLYSWAMAEGLVQVSGNPAAGIERPVQELKRQTRYDDDSLRKVFQAAEGTRLQGLVGLVAYCATRDNETRTATWAQFDLEKKLWSIPVEVSKTGEIQQQEHHVPLSSGALRVLKTQRERNMKAGLAGSPYVFPARRTPGDDEPKPMEKPGRQGREISLRLHDLRRTVATRLWLDLKVPPHVIEAVLGHAQPGLAQVYYAGQPVDEMRKALQKWSDALDAILSAKPKPEEHRA